MIKYKKMVSLLSVLLPFSAFSNSTTSTAPESEASKGWFAETLYNEWQQNLKISKILKEEKTQEQSLIVFENPLFGRVLALDGIVQLTEADEFIYHEMLAHVPLFTHGHAESVLIIGGGDGGVAREVLRHPSVKKLTLVEIDASVVDFAKEYLPSVSNGAFNDPRFHLVISDGAEFVKKADERFDVVIVDSTDPIGPGAALFTEEFFKNCKRVLKPRGILVNQNGVPFVQSSEMKESYEKRVPHFKDVGYYVAPVSTYIGGFMTLGWATDDPSYRTISVEEIAKRLKEIKGEMKYYNPEIHKASFALPNYIRSQLQ
jgi:spermidine synthase